MRATEGLAWYNKTNREGTPFSHFKPSRQDKKLRAKILKERNQKKASDTLFQID